MIYSRYLLQFIDYINQYMPLNLARGLRGAPQTGAPRLKLHAHAHRLGL